MVSGLQSLGPDPHDAFLYPQDGRAPCPRTHRQSHLHVWVLGKPKSNRVSHAQVRRIWILPSPSGGLKGARNRRVNSLSRHYSNGNCKEYAYQERSRERRPGAIRLEQAYERRNYGPERVASAIVKAIRKNKGLVLVSPESWLMYYTERFLPILSRFVARRAAAHLFEPHGNGP